MYERDRNIKAKIYLQPGLEAKKVENHWSSLLSSPNLSLSINNELICKSLERMFGLEKKKLWLYTPCLKHVDFLIYPSCRDCQQRNQHFVFVRFLLKKTSLGLLGHNLRVVGEFLEIFFGVSC